MKKGLIIISFLFCYCSYAQKNDIVVKSRDTIFFKLDKNYFKKGKYNEDQYYIKDALNDKGNSELFFFKVIEIHEDHTSKILTELRPYLRNSEYYHNERKSNRFDDYSFASHLQKYIVYLVDVNYEHSKYLKVYPMTEIE